MTLLLIYLAIAIFFSFLCSVLEAVILSITPSHIGITLEEKPSLGKEIQKMKRDIDKPLAAILSLNTFAHTIGAAGVGAQAQAIWGEEYLSIISVILTLAILFLSEIIPKTIGANYWKAITPLAIPVLRWMIIILYPLVIVSQFLTKLLKRDKDKPILSRSDFGVLADMGLKSGIFKKEETEIIKNLIHFNKVTAKDVMTPRTVLFVADESMTFKNFYDTQKDNAFSRIPVYFGGIDNITGYVMRDEVLAGLIEKRANDNLKSIRRNISTVYENIPIPEAFKLLMNKNEQIAIVLDEHGSVEGIITLEDIVETLLGIEIVDEMDNYEDLQKLARQSWERRAKAMGLINKN
jgi:CBS domain containing-hemolysin-like protein